MHDGHKPYPQGSFHGALDFDIIVHVLKILQRCPVFLRIKVNLFRIVYSALYNLATAGISKFLGTYSLNLLVFLVASVSIMCLSLK